MTGPGDRRYRLAVVAIVLVALLAPGLRSFHNLPYYHHADEGHLLLWTHTIFADRAPDNIFYGPLLYYLYLPAAAVGHGVAALTGSDELYFTEARLSPNPPRAAFYEDFHPAWMLAVARGYSMAFFALAIFAVAALLRRTAGSAAALSGALLLASVPFCQRFAAHAQPEMAILGLGCLTLLYAERRVERSFDARATVFLGLLLAALGALKIYALLYGGLGWLVVAYGAPGRRRQNALLFAATVLGATLLLYAPYRSPRDLVRVMSWAAEYYQTKPPGSLVATLLTADIYTPVHLALFALGIGALLPGFPRGFRSAAPRGGLAVLGTAAALAAVNVAWFQTFRFANTRNVVLVCGVGAILAGRAIGLLLQIIPARCRGVATGLVLALQSALLLGVSLPTGLAARTERDPRLVAADAVREELSPPARAFVSLETLIHDSTLPPEAVRRFRQALPASGITDQIAPGDLLVVREEKPLSPDLDGIRRRARLLVRTAAPDPLGVYRVTSRLPPSTRR